MEGDIRKYLDLIGDHLKEHHAAVMVGAGFSRNAAKIDDTIPDSPNWLELADAFAEILSTDAGEQKRLKGLSPLVLAEQVEVTYGRPELDHLLQSSIRDRDYLPSALHHKLLSLSWSDIFTTNYDTLLERASNEITEKSFTVVTRKDDLIGSASTTRIIKLHGSFPSHRPFIITSEDYRTYPLKFAPFVNTVQQSLLENTLCLIGFSGNDPNFEKWIGWIRDNLGETNSPNIYLLLHYCPSEAESALMRRKKIIPVDLSQLTPGKPPAAVYEAALDYLFERERSDRPEHWNLTQTLHNEQGQLFTMEYAIVVLREIRESYPGWIVVPSGQREMMRHIASYAERILAQHCNENPPASDIELEYLYEYDWLRERTLLPPFSSLKFYHQILDRHAASRAPHKLSVQLSLLRDLRECGDWAGWSELHEELHAASTYLNIEQHHQLWWEECLFAFARYQFQELATLLENWKVKPSMPLWTLRKAGLLAEFGKLDDAHILLRDAILNIRKRLSHQRQVNLALLSLESALMYLQGYITQALKWERLSAEKDERQKEEKAKETAAEEADFRHRALHAQHYVDWESQDSYFTARLEAPWKPYQTHRVAATFDFGVKSGSRHFGENKELMLAFSYLRFREECGIPFYVSGIHSGKEAACGAAERIALYAPFWSILTLVRVDEPKKVGFVISRGVLSSWTRAEADERCQFYLDAILRTEPELGSGDWFDRESFARLAADVLPEVVSELCTKCSISVLDKVFDLLKGLYLSEKKLCYQQTPSLLKRFIAAYPSTKHQELFLQLLQFPLIEDSNEMANRYFPNPLKYTPAIEGYAKITPKRSLPEVERLFAKCKQKKEAPAELDQLLRCLYQGFLTDKRKQSLFGLLWDGTRLHVPNAWLRIVCLDIPLPANANVLHYLCKALTEEVEGYAGHKERAKDDVNLLHELQVVAVKGCGAFSDEQISSILASFEQRISALSSNLGRYPDFAGMENLPQAQLYEIADTIWLLTSCKQGWVPTDENRQTMANILDQYNKIDLFHYGLQAAWRRLLGISFDATKELASCLRSPKEEDARWAYEVLAIGFFNPEFSLLTEAETQIGLTVLAQQVVWGVPKQLATALRVAQTAIVHRPDLIVGGMLESLLTGLSQLKQQTVIGVDDTVETASEKGYLRMCAASLAKKIQQAGLCGNQSEILDEWMAIIDDESEFAEVRNV